MDKTYAHIDGGTSNPGYFSKKSAKSATAVTNSVSNFSLQEMMINDLDVDSSDVNIEQNDFELEYFEEEPKDTGKYSDFSKDKIQLNDDKEREDDYNSEENEESEKNNVNDSVEENIKVDDIEQIIEDNIKEDKIDSSIEEDIKVDNKEDDMKDNEQDLEQKDEISDINSSDDIIEEKLTDNNVINQELDLPNQEKRNAERQSITTYNIIEKDSKEEKE